MSERVRHAVVLVGGEGTRLRPLTETIPKPLVDFLDRPFLHRVLDHLAAFGVEEAVLSSPYLEEAFAAFLESRRGSAPRLRWVTEDTPLGTGGAVANAARGLDEPFLVLNGDVVTDLDLGALVGRHRETRAAATIALTPVEDARPYGLVTTEGTRVLEFREKPREAVAGEVNAGTYVLEPEAVVDVPAGRSVSIEREVFPALIAAGRTVSAFSSGAYWIDLGTPDRFLRAHADAMAGRIAGLRAPAPYRGPGSDVDGDADVGEDVCVGTSARVEAGARVEGSVLMRGAVVRRGATVAGSIVGPGAEVGRDAVVSGAVLAEGARVPDGARAAGARVGPNAVLAMAPPAAAGR